MDLMENNWTNPFSDMEKDLICISTGSVAPPEIAKDLLQAVDVGEDAYQSFKSSRLHEISPTVNSMTE